MKKLPKGGLIGKAVDAYLAIREKQIPLHAAYAGYFIILSIFPALLMLLSLLRFTGIQVENLVSLMEDFLPHALMETAEELVYSTWANSTGTVLGLSALTALWSASRGIFGLLQGLNAVYDVWEDRGWLYTRGISVVYALLFLVVVVLTLVLHVFGNTLMELLRGIQNPAVMTLVDLIDLRGILLLAIQVLLFSAIYMVLPNKRNGFWESLPGAVFSAVGWAVYSWAFSLYVTHFSKISNIYGSMYSIAVSMLWLYCCVSILFYGAALNKLLSQYREKQAA